MATKKVRGAKRHVGKSARINAIQGAKLQKPMVTAAARVRKNMDMDPAKLRAVKEIFGAKTETEAVDRALEEIIFEHRVAAGLEAVASAGGLPAVDPDA